MINRDNYPLLRELLNNRKISVSNIASKCGCTEMSIRNKFYGKSDFTVKEAIAIKELLNTDEKIEDLFK